MDDNAAHIAAGLSDAAEWFFALTALVLLACHLLLHSNTWRKTSRLVFGIALLVVPLAIITLVSARPLVRFSTIVTCVFVYAVSLFVVLSEVLTLFVGAPVLTRWRG